MDSFDKRGLILDRPPKRRSPGSRLAMLGSRLARPPQDHTATPPYGVEPDDRMPYDEGPVPRFPIIFLTSNENFDAKAAALGADCLTKPCDWKRLLKLVAHRLGHGWEPIAHAIPRPEAAHRARS